MRNPARTSRRSLLLAAAAAAVGAAKPIGAAAQGGYPQKPITLMVAYPAGGIADLLGRKLAEQLTKAWGQPVVVENRPGANQLIAATALTRAAPDGYTMLLCDDGVFTLNPLLFRRLPYDTRDLTPIIDLADARIVLSMAKEVPAANLHEMIAYAKAHPGKLNYASLGIGNIHHLMLESLKKQAGINLVHVPYKGYAQAIQDVLANHAQLVSGGIGGPVLEHLRTGALKPLAVTGGKRSALLPAVPTFAEAGFPNLRPRAHFILAGPRAMPAAVVEQINTIVAAILKTDFEASVLAPNGMEALGNKSSSLAADLQKSLEGYASIVKELAITLD